MVVAAERWVLKGALALHFRLGVRFRTTKDLDLGRWDGEWAATADLLAAQRLDLGDYFQFTVEKTDKVGALLEDEAIRYHVSAFLANRSFEEVIVDVGFGDSAVGVPERLRGPALLHFADIEPSNVPAVRIEPHVAEKLHAYSRRYAGGRLSTRVKDLIDLVLIATFLSLEAGQLRAALRTTFDVRGTHALPEQVPAPPSQWATAYAKMAAEAGLAPELSAGYERARMLLDPILSGIVPGDARWDPLRQTW